MKVKIGPYKTKKKRKIKVKIHKYDSWNVDDTLAHIIVPLLKQLKKTKHGAPSVDEEDVPEELWAPQHQISGLYQGETDDNYFKRWDWVMDEMIWAFQQKISDNGTDQFYGPYHENPDGGIMGRFEWIDANGLKMYQKRMSNGFRLFGKYYESLWD